MYGSKLKGRAVWKAQGERKRNSYWGSKEAQSTLSSRIRMLFIIKFTPCTVNIHNDLEKRDEVGFRLVF